MYLKKGFEKYIDITEIKTEYNCWKVIMARASYKHKSGFGICMLKKTFIVKHIFHLMYRVKMKHYLSYFNCKLPNFILSLRKIRKTFPNQLVNGFHYHH
jgi:hypothetical protein